MGTLISSYDARGALGLSDDKLKEGEFAEGKFTDGLSFPEICFQRFKYHFT